jgi:molecular chaperone GrpE
MSAAGPDGAAGAPPKAAEDRARADLKDARRQLLELQEKLAAAEERAAEAGDKYLRTAAEMENMRRRHRQEQLDRLQFGNAELITKLLPVLDNFERALEHAPEAGGESGDETVAQWVSGLSLVERQLRDLLESEGVTLIEALGQRFDPNFHQAVMSEPSAEHDDGTVVGELQRGYQMNDRVLRPSLVKVVRNS